MRLLHNAHINCTNKIITLCVQPINAFSLHTIYTGSNAATPEPIPAVSSASSRARSVGNYI